MLAEGVESYPFAEGTSETPLFPVVPLSLVPGAGFSVVVNLAASAFLPISLSCSCKAFATIAWAFRNVSLSKTGFPEEGFSELKKVEISV